jgi:isopentenyl diphosphate isomerase/L-lactate dehydrogenase-like FMN-dependent dehydrogenase
LESEALGQALTLQDLERLAASTLDRPAFDYIAGGAGDEQTLSANVEAFRKWQLRPRVLVDVSRIATNTTFLGRPVAVPFAVAPVAFQDFAHPEAEVATARAAASAGALFCLSTMSSRSMEEVAAASDVTRPKGETAPAPRWFQLYVHRDRARSEDLVKRAAGAGFGAIVVTLDFAVAGNRERDRRNGLAYPQQFGNFELASEGGTTANGSIGMVIGGLNDASLTWRDLEWLRGATELPVVLKGVLTSEDAALAVDHGVDGLIVSNHGGRQLDRTPPTIDVLAEIVDAVAGRAEVYLDGGVRRGADVITALALGARGVFVGRPIVFGLAVGGEKGARRAIDILADELRTDLALLGTTTPEELGRQHLRRP